MAVYGVCHFEPEGGGAEGGAQSRKFLVLYEVASKVFFLGTWPSWRRVPDPKFALDPAFDPDNDVHVKFVTLEVGEAMCKEFLSLGAVFFAGNLAKAKREAEQPPPTLKLARDEETRVQKEAAKEAEKEARKQQRKAAAAKAGAKAGRERASRGRPDPPPPPSSPHEGGVWAGQHSCKLGGCGHRGPPSPPPPKRQLQELDTPPSIVQLKQELNGLRRTQGVEQTAARAQQIGEAEYDLERRQAKFIRHGR